MNRYRAHQHETHKPTLRQLRRHASDQLEVFQAVAEEQALFRLYSGIDTDARAYLEASAKRVGLEFPKPGSHTKS